MRLNSRKNIENLEGPSARTAIPQAIHRHKRSRAVEKILFVALLAFGFSSLSQALWTVSAHADEVSDLMSSPSDQSENLSQPDAVDSCLANLPTPPLKPGLHRVIQLVNCSNQ